MPGFDEDQVEEQGIHALNRGFVYTRDNTKYMFSPSAFAEARMPFIQDRATRFNNLVEKVQNDSDMADKVPHVAEWIERTKKTPRRFADSQKDFHRVDFVGLEHDLLHYDVQILKDDKGDIIYFTRDGLRIPKHFHRSSRNLTRKKPLKPLDGKSEVPLYGRFSEYGGVSLRVKSKEHGGNEQAMSYWDVHVSNPFLEEGNISKGFDIDSGVQSHRHNKRKARLFCELDLDIINKLNRERLDDTRDRQLILVSYHEAVALSKIFLEHKKRGNREIRFLDGNLEKIAVMPYVFVSGFHDDLVFDVLTAHYGLGLDYDETDKYLLGFEEEICTDLFRDLLSTNRVTREVVKSKRGMSDNNTRRIIKNVHYDFSKRGYRFEGFATVFKGTKYETIGITYVKDNEVRYVLYDNSSFIRPLVLDRHMSESGKLFGDIEVLRPMNLDLHPFSQENLRLLDYDYRSGKKDMPSTISRPVPSLLTNEDKTFYDAWYHGIEKFR